MSSSSHQSQTIIHHSFIIRWIILNTTCENTPPFRFRKSDSIAHRGDRGSLQKWFPSISCFWRRIWVPEATKEKRTNHSHCARPLLDTTKHTSTQLNVQTPKTDQIHTRTHIPLYSNVPKRSRHKKHSSVEMTAPDSTHGRTNKPSSKHNNPPTEVKIVGQKRTMPRSTT